MRSRLNAERTRFHSNLEEARDKINLLLQRSQQSETENRRLRTAIQEGVIPQTGVVLAILDNDILLLRRNFSTEIFEAKLYAVRLVKPIPEDFLRRVCSDTDIQLRDRGVDNSGNLRVSLSIDGYDVATELVRTGWALYDSDAFEDAALLSAEQSAREQGLGVWSQGIDAGPPRS